MLKNNHIDHYCTLKLLIFMKFLTWCENCVHQTFILALNLCASRRYSIKCTFYLQWCPFSSNYGDWKSWKSWNLNLEWL